ncbi:flavodoxin family protein [Trichlorobacter lovleyi]|jgi:multimeric flavodoxin WrbA|uniref:flavodoxin family protein n=1 Tax=Trichlorobacter lovleyi TaxID=313985 RepID=UPI003D0EE56D
MKVLGVSGSPIRNSNTDRALKLALESTGLETEFIKLTDYTIEPCRACLGCRKTGQCVIKDDGFELTEKVKESDALIIAGYTPYSTLDSRTKAFIERLYPNRHGIAHMKGKPGGAIVTYCIPKSIPMFPASQNGVDAIKYYMMEEEMDYVGDVQILGNIPCVRCKDADTCATSGIKMLFGPEATVAETEIGVFEEQPEIVAAAIKLGEDIAAKLKA